MLASSVSQYLNKSKMLPFQPLIFLSIACKTENAPYWTVPRRYPRRYIFCSSKVSLIPCAAVTETWPRSFLMATQTYSEQTLNWAKALNWMHCFLYQKNPPCTVSFIKNTVYEECPFLNIMPIELMGKEVIMWGKKAVLLHIVIMGMVPAQK